MCFHTCKIVPSKQREGLYITVKSFSRYPPRLELNKSEKLGSYYGFKGSKILSSDKNALKSKVKLEYEVFVRVVEVNE